MLKPSTLHGWYVERAGALPNKELLLHGLPGWLVSGRTRQS